MPEATSVVNILVQNSPEDVTLKVSQPEDEKITSEEDGKATKPRIMYSKEDLLELRSAPASLQRPECLTEEFFHDGVWDIQAWHKSSSSRCASPAVDGKCVTFDTGKKIELLDNIIELAPQRRSFFQGCYVPSASESEKEKDGPSKRLGGRVGLGSDSKASFNEGKDRLTARASLRRRTIEKATSKDNKSELEHKPKSKGNHEAKNDDDDRRDQRNWIEDKREGKSRSRSFKENREDNKENWKRGDWHGGKLPEWMTDGPSSQTDVIELKGFGKEIEDERNAMRKESKGEKKAERTRKTSKGSSRSSTPSQVKDKRQKLPENGDGYEAKPKGADRNGGQRLTPTDKGFNDDDAYFDVMDYLPPHLFTDDFGNDISSQSKFSQWFQGQEGTGANGSRPSSIPLGLESKIMRALKPESPMAQLQPYFTPIQPAPPTHAFENPIPISPLMDLFPKRPKSRTENVNEVKGRMSLKDIEPDLPKPIGQKPDKTEGPEESNKLDLTAFDKLVCSMKAAGQLPDKPAPVVSGLPEHLLPKPPKRTSPSFEKLKRALSRSPSPLGMGRMSPLYFAGRQMSPLMQPVGERLLSPDFFKQPVKQRSVSPGRFFSEYQDNVAMNKDKSGHYQRWAQDEQRRHANDQRSESFTNGLQTPDSFRTPKHAGSSIVPAAFLPTSVIKKMHSEKSETGEHTGLYAEDAVSKFDFANQSLRQLDRKLNQERGPEALPHTDIKPFSKKAAQNPMQNPIESDQLYSGLRSQNARDFEKPLFSKHQSSSTDGNPRKSGAAQQESLGRNSLVDRSMQSTGQLQRDFSSLSVNSAPGSDDLMGSGSLFTKYHDDDVEGVKRTPFDFNKDKQSEHVSHLSSSNRIQMAPGPISGSSKAIANENRMKHLDNGSRTHGTSMPPKPLMNQNLLQNGSQSNSVNQGNLPRGPVAQKPQQPPFSQAHQFQRNRNPAQSNPRLPLAMNPPANNLPFNRPNIPAVTAAMAAQLVQQQLLQQAARAHVLQAAQVIQQQQQQQQQQNLIRMQMQAAMAQAYVRGQAAKAMMHNSRAVANNLQAVAQQIGLLGPQSAQTGKPLPTPLVSQQQQQQQQLQRDGNDQGQGNSEKEPQKLQDSPLSKWFNVDEIKKTPPAPTQDPGSKAKFISVEDLERSHNESA
eukprot:gene16039-7384_t